MEKLEIMNEAIFRGRIVRIREANGNGTITLACPLITTVRKKGIVENGTRVNYPVLSFNKNTVTPNIAETFKQGDHVIVKGYVQSYMRLDENSGDAKEIMNLYIREIMPDTSKMMNAFGVEGRTYPESQNEVYLSGVLSGITKRNDAIALLRIDLSQERKNVVNAVYFRAPANVISDLSIGETINVLAMVQTVDTKERKMFRNYQELVILDIAR